MTVIDDLIDRRIIPLDFDGNLPEEDLFYLKLKEPVLADFLISKKILKEKYPSYMYLPYHFNELEDTQPYYITHSFYNSNSYNLHEWAIHKHITNTKYEITTKIKNDGIEANINGNWYELNYNIFYNIVDAKLFIVNDIEKDLI